MQRAPVPYTENARTNEYYGSTAHSCYRLSPSDLLDSMRRNLRRIRLFKVTHLRQ